MTEPESATDDPEAARTTDPTPATMTENDTTSHADDPTDAGDSTGTDADTTTGTESDATPEADADATAETDAEDSTDRDVLTYLYWGALFVLGLLAAVALLRFYANAGAAIATWIAPRFEPIVQAAFNLVVLLAATIGISLVVRELSG